MNLFLEDSKASPLERPGSTISSRYKTTSGNENTAITPRSGLDTGMSFSFSSFGDEKKKKTRNNRHHRPFKPTRVSFQQSTSKRLNTPKIGPLILLEYATPSSKSFQVRQYIAYTLIGNKSSTVFIDISLTICDELNLTDINSSTNMSDTKDDKLDDFREIFDPIGTRIIYVVFWIIYVTLTNAFFILMVLYEKYGADIMKRSIDNRLWAQALLAMILYNSVCSTIFLMRFIFGPLPLSVAAFESFVANCWISWELLLLTEISVVKALLNYKMTWILGINENFAGRFLLRFNLGYTLISQTGRFVHKYFMQFRFELI